MSYQPGNHKFILSNHVFVIGKNIVLLSNQVFMIRNHRDAAYTRAMQRQYSQRLFLPAHVMPAPKVKKTDNISLTKAQVKFFMINRLD
jgi:hypothetical protein